MKLRLLLLLAAALAAAPASGQIIKSLGYNTTNGNVVAATNVTFTNSVGFATNARAATRANLGGTTVGNAVFTATNAAAAASAVGLSWSALTNAQSTLYSGQATRLLGYAPEIAASSTNPTGFNVLAYTNTNGLVIPANLLIGEDQTSGGPRNPRNVTVNGAVTIQYPFSSPSTIYANNSITATDASTYTNTLVTWSSNTATFATNLSVSGSLTATGNAVLNGVNNTMPGATNAASGASLMTRDLVDNRSLNYAINSFPNLRFSSITAAGGTVIDTPWNTGAYTAATTNAIAHGRLMFPLDSIQFGTVTSPNKFWLFTRVSLFFNTNNALDTVTFGDAGGTNTVQYPLEDGTSTNPAYVSYGANSANDDNRFAIQLRHNSTNIQARLISMRPGSPSGVYSETAWTNVAVSPILSTLAERPLLIALQRNNTNVIAYAAQATGIAQAYIDANSLQVIGSATIESGGYNPALGFRAVSKSGNLMRVEFMNTQAVVTP
jgi:hypothetical protein